MEHIKWSEIESFHNIRKLIANYPCLLSNTGVVEYRGKVKLHGTNAAVQLLTAGEVVAQSRTSVISLSNDNAGFARWVDSVKNNWVKNRPVDRELVIFGEWCGPGIQKGVAINQIPEKVFVVFAAQTIGTEDLIVEPKDLQQLVAGVPNTHVLPWATDLISVKWQAPSEELQLPLTTINNLVAEVEKCDPWVKEIFSVEGLGEGLVFYPVSHPGRKAFSDFAFKAKGEKHKVVASKAAAQIDPEVAASAEAFAGLVLTEARLEQGATEIGAYDIKNVGKFIGWVSKDVQKETVDELEASNLDWKQVQRPVSERARSWYLDKCRTL